MLPLSQRILKIFFVITLLLFGTTSIAFGQRCKYEKDEIDGITELIVRRTVPEMLLRIDNLPVYAKAQCIGDNKYLKIVIQNYGEFVFQEEREIAFELVNGQELTLYPRIMPKKDTLSQSYTTMMVYKLSSVQVEILESSPVSSFKYYISTGWVTEPIKPSRQEVIMDMLQCLSKME